MAKNDTNTTVETVETVAETKASKKRVAPIREAWTKYVTTRKTLNAELKAKRKAMDEAIRKLLADYRAAKKQATADRKAALAEFDQVRADFLKAKADRKAEAETKVAEKVTAKKEAKKTAKKTSTKKAAVKAEKKVVEKAAAKKAAKKVTAKKSAAKPKAEVKHLTKEECDAGIARGEAAIAKAKAEAVVKAE